MARIGYDEALDVQSDALVRSAAHVREQLRRLDATPFTSGIVGVVGIGASLNAAHLLVDVLRRAGRPAIAISAGAALDPGLPVGVCDVFVFLSESGDSTETLRIANGVIHGPSRPTLSVTNDPGSALAGMTDLHVDLGSGPDSGVYTVGFTATLQAVALLAAWMGVGNADTWLPSDVPVPDIAALEAVAGRLVACRGIDVIGAGPHLCSALQTALMLREGCRLPSAAFDTREYLHGPLEWLGPGSGCILFGSEDSDRETELASFARSVGATAVRFGPRTTTGSADPSDIAVTSGGAVSAVVHETIAVQHLVRALARLRDVPIGTMRHAQADTKRTGTY